MEILSEWCWKLQEAVKRLKGRKVWQKTRSRAALESQIGRQTTDIRLRSCGFALETVTMPVTVSRSLLSCFLCNTYSKFRILGKGIRLPELKSLACVMTARLGVKMKAGRDQVPSCSIVGGEVLHPIHSCPFWISNRLAYPSFHTHSYEDVLFNEILEKERVLSLMEQESWFVSLGYKFSGSVFHFIYLKRGILPCYL